jgi:translocation and assembly module TamB
MTVTGTSAEPSAHLDASARGLTVGAVTVGDPHLTLAADGTSPATLRLELARVGGASAVAQAPSGTISVETPLALGRLLRERPSAETLMRTPFAVKGELREVPLAAVARVLGRADRVRGTASLRIAAQGTAREPTGAVNLTVSGAARADFPPTDARVDVALGDRDTRLAARVWRQGRPQPLVAVSATWGVTAARLLAASGSSAAWANAPLDVRLAAGPAELRHRARITTKPGQPQTLSVHARAEVKVTGTLRQPVVELDGALTDARIADKPAGGARLRARYADARAHLDLAMSTAGGGALHLQAATRAELGYPKGIAALDVATLPLDVSLDARAFDLGWLTGLGDRLRRVGGQLDAAVRAEGTLTAPLVAGRLELKRGELASPVTWRAPMGTGSCR